MWPFTSQRIFGNRWWAVAFVIFVCWQVIDFVPHDDGNASNAITTDATGAPVDDAQLRALKDSFNAM